jgi:hypothetical protein
LDSFIPVHAFCEAATDRYGGVLLYERSNPRAGRSEHHWRLENPAIVKTAGCGVISEALTQ